LERELNGAAQGKRVRSMDFSGPSILDHRWPSTILEIHGERWGLVRMRLRTLSIGRNS
jgi:hypothetical protein